MSRAAAILVLILGFAGLLRAQERVLNVGDRISILSSEDPTLCIERVIDFQGAIRLPGDRTLALVGLSLGQAIQQIARLERQAPETLSLRLAENRSDPISIGGAVSNAGIFGLLPQMHLADAVRVAQPSIAADLDSIEIESSDGEVMTVAYDPNPLHPEDNPLLRSGDRIVFPLATTSANVTVLGGVAKPGSVPFAHGMTLKAALEAAGGITNHGNGKDTRVLRSGVEVARLDAGESGDYELKRGETVIVALSDVRLFVTVVGEVGTGGLVAWKKGMTLGEAIHDAGGVTGSGDPDGLRVQRMVGEDRFRKQMSATKDKDFVLNANDVIQVPPKGHRIAAPRIEPGPHRVVPPQ